MSQPPLPPYDPQDPASQPGAGAPPGYGQAPQYEQAPQHGEAPQYGEAPGYGQAPQYGQPPQYGPPPEMSPADQRLWGMLAHLSAIASALIGLTFVGPLVIFLVLKDRGIFVRHQAAEALNFQILVNAVALALGVVTLITFGLGGLLYIPLGIVALVFVILAAVKANQGVDHRYPINWRLVK